MKLLRISLIICGVLHTPCSQASTADTSREQIGQNGAVAIFHADAGSTASTATANENVHENTDVAPGDVPNVSVLPGKPAMRL